VKFTVHKNTFLFALYIYLFSDCISNIRRLYLALPEGFDFQFLVVHKAANQPVEVPDEFRINRVDL